MINRLLSFATLLLIAGCSSQSSTKEIKTPETKTANTKVDSSQVQPVTTVADAATIMARKQVPILCYHHIRDIQMVSKASMGYEVTVNEFKAQMKALVR
jgi:PBP1b-binding outer membrane lipoprotein LpoB